MRLNRRLYVPAGAAAIIAFTLVTVRFSTPTQIAQVTNTAPRIAAADPAVEMLAATVVAEPEQIRISSHEEPIALTSAPALTGASAPVVTSPRETESPAARSFPAALARLEPVESELAGAIMSSRLSAPARVQPAALAQPEVASVPNGNGSKYRLIARYADRSLSPEPTAPASIRERLARRLGDDLGDSISRIGVVGDRVSLRF